jgi:hypothetical protein
MLHCSSLTLLKVSYLKQGEIGFTDFHKQDKHQIKFSMRTKIV